MTKNDTAVVRWPKLILGTFVLLFAGVIYAWSILNTPFMHISTTDGVDVILNSAQLGFIYSITIVFFCLGSFLSGIISKRTTVRLRFLLSALLVFSSFFISSFHVSYFEHYRNYFQLIIAYSVLGGLGIGIAYNSVISTVNMWYPDKRGFSSGILLMGFGGSALIVGGLANILATDHLLGWQNTYIALAVTIALIMIVAAIFIRPPREHEISSILSKLDSTSKKPEKSSKAATDYSAREMIKHPAFILVFIYTTFLATSGSVAISFGSEIITGLGATRGFAVLAVGLVGVSNSIGRLICGLLFDKAGIKATQYISSTVAILAPLSLVIAIYTSSLPVGVIGLCLCGISFGFAPTTCSVFASNYFGEKNFPLNFSIFSLILIPAPFAATLAGILKTTTGSFISTFIILIGLTGIGFFLNLFVKKP